MRVLLAAGLLGACTAPLDLPEDPSEPGVPVGVRTLVVDGHTVEVWYPASDSVAGLPGEVIDVTRFVPQAVVDHIGPVDLPGIATPAVRDAELRRLPEAAPVLLFSHGFGGMRVQSATLTSHLASRGYVVMATDHTGRTLSDVLPCLFSPALDGCDLSGFATDPAEDDLDDLLDALTDLRSGSFLAGTIDIERVGLFGHSAGANSTTTLANEDDRIDAYVTMAGGRPVTADVPGLFITATCDYTTPAPPLRSNAEQSDADYLGLAGAGHLAFSDLCDLELVTFAQDNLLQRDDLDSTFTGLLLGLAGDGCADGTPDPEVEDFESCSDGFVLPSEVAPALRGAVTAHFDATLRPAE